MGAEQDHARALRRCAAGEFGTTCHDPLRQRAAEQARPIAVTTMMTKSDGGVR